MGTANALHTHGTGTDGGSDARTARLAQAGLLAVQGPSALDARTGVLWGPGATAILTGNSDTGPMTVTIGVHVPVSTRGAANGPYLGPALTAAVKVSLAAAPGAGAGDRIDIVYMKQQDATPGVPSPDAVYAPLYGVVTGTAGAGKPTAELAAIAGAEEIGTVTVSPGAVSSNGAGVTIANTARLTVARGARIPVRNQTERDALTTFAGLEVYRLDTGRIEARNAGNTAWITVFDPAVLSAPTWQSISVLSTWWEHYVTAGARVENWRVFLRGWLHTLAAVGAGGGITASPLPANMRPAANRGIWAPWENAAGTANGVTRLEIQTTGHIVAVRGVGNDTYVNLDGLSWPLS